MTVGAPDAGPRVEQLKRAHPLAEVVAGYGIALRPGGRALVGLCPFHGDQRHPNLHVYAAADPARDSWYCFRCAAGGDVLTFVMRRERLGFVAACQHLAGLPPPATPPPPAPPRPDRPRGAAPTLDEQVVLDAAAALYQRTLWRTPRALAYLRERGVPAWLARAQGIGFADGHSLEAFLRRRADLRVAQRLGLLRPARPGDDGRAMREHLAGRVVVPELRGGHAVWFVGRALDGAPDRPKYLALPGERPVLGLEHAVGRREALLCEGVFDYLTARAWGLPAFSPGGTHPPHGRLAFLDRARVVYGALDGDAAGREAAGRLAEQLGARWRPLALPDGRDLNDLGRQPGGREAFFALLDRARRAAAEATDAG